MTSPCPTCGLQRIPEGDYGDELVRRAGNESTTPYTRTLHSVLTSAVVYVEKEMTLDDVVFARQELPEE